MERGLLKRLKTEINNFCNVIHWDNDGTKISLSNPILWDDILGYLNYFRKPGVYVYLIDDSAQISANEEILYVGKSISNTAYRIKQHHNQFKTNFFRDYDELTRIQEIQYTYNQIAVVSIDLNPRYYYIAPALELYLIYKLCPLLNKEGTRYLSDVTREEITQIRAFNWYDDAKWYDSSLDEWKILEQLLNSTLKLFPKTERRRITPHDGAVRYYGFYWGLQGKRYYKSDRPFFGLTTNYREKNPHQFSQLLLYHPGHQPSYLPMNVHTIDGIYSWIRRILTTIQ